MIAPATSLASSSPSVDHAKFMALLPRVLTHAHITFRHLKCRTQKEEAVQECASLAWKWFVRLCERGKDASDFPVGFVCLVVKAVKCGRRVCGNERTMDVLSPQAQQYHGFTVESLPVSTRTSVDKLYSTPHGQKMHDAFEERLRDNTQTPIPDQAAFRIDWPAWLATITERDRQLVEDLALNHRTKDLAQKYRLSEARISQKRRQFQDEWERFCGEREPVVA